MPATRARTVCYVALELDRGHAFADLDPIAKLADLFTRHPQIVNHCSILLACVEHPGERAAVACAAANDLDHSPDADHYESDVDAHALVALRSGARSLL